MKADRLMHEATSLTGMTTSSTRSLKKKRVEEFEDKIGIKLKIRLKIRSNDVREFVAQMCMCLCVLVYRCVVCKYLLGMFQTSAHVQALNYSSSSSSAAVAMVRLWGCGVLN